MSETSAFYLRQQHFFSSKYFRSATSPCLPILNESIGRWYPITRVQTSHFVLSLFVIPSFSSSVIFLSPYLSWIAHLSMIRLSETAYSAHLARVAEHFSSAGLNRPHSPSSLCNFRCIAASRSRTRIAESLRVVIDFSRLAISLSFLWSVSIW